MSQDSIQTILASIAKLDDKLGNHIMRSDTLHEETRTVLGEIKPILENIQAAKKVGGWIGWIFNTKLGWVALVALAGYLGLKN